jgi:ribonuclease D
MALPVLQYRGPIHLVVTDAELHRAVREIRHERVVGFDTETRPTFRKGQSHHPSLAQFATHHAAYLVQLAKLNDVAALAAVLSDPRVIKTGVALGRDLLDLQKLFPFQPAAVLDLGDVAKKAGITQTGVRNLAGLFLGGRITKGARTSNWAQPVLTAAQCRYAATDAWVCRELYLEFERRHYLRA